MTQVETPPSQDKDSLFGRVAARIATGATAEVALSCPDVIPAGAPAFPGELVGTPLLPPREVPTARGTFAA
jgi:hypothetical protein